MKIVWRLGSATVRDVYEELLKRRKIAYTTVMTMMGTLEEKGYLAKSESVGRAYVYKPAETERNVLGGLVQDFVKRVFGGSRHPLFVHLLESEDTTTDELEELSKLLREKRRKK